MKINSCFIFALFLLVSLAIAIETSQHETINKEAKGAKVEPAYGGGGNWGGGGGGGNWGGGGGGGCRYGCCYRGYRGCQRCCASLEEAKASPEKQETMSTEAKGAAEGNKVEPEATEANKVEPAGGGGGNWGGGGGGGNWGGGGCRHGCCYQGYRGCQRCCASPEEAKALADKQDTMSKEAKTEANKVGPEEKGAGDQAKVEPAGGGGGNWGGGGGGGNWGGGGGGGCRYGCCYRGYRGCQRCCASLDEAKALTEKQHHP